MKRSEFLGLLAASACLSGCQVVEPVWQMFSFEAEKAGDMFVKPFRDFKIMSWNIRAGLGMDGVRDISRAVAVIKSAEVDVVALQEIDRFTKRANGVDQLAELEKGTGLIGTWCKAIDYDGGEYGVALLSREAPLGVRRVKLPLLGKNEQRVLLVVEFAEYFIGVTHLSLLPEERMAAAEVLRNFVASDKPFFLAGDWNDEPRSDSIRKIRNSFALLSGVEPTYPSPKPDRCIDYIALSRRHRARYEHVTHEVLPEAVVSDHRPVVVSIR